MKVIVTGGAGFIGSHLVDALIKKGHQVMILDDFSAGNKKFVNPRAKIAKINTHDYKKMERVFKSFRPRAVFHLAAQIEIRSLFEDKKRYATDSMNVLRLAQIYGVDHLIFSSSAAVYGINTKLPLKEHYKILPVSAYGHSKANFESSLASQYRGDKLKVVALRYANVYGPRQGTVGEGGVVAIFCKRLLKNNPLKIFGNGEQTRDFVFVSDVVESNLKALKSRKVFAVYNVSTQKETTVNHLAQALLKIAGAKTGVFYSPAVAGDVMRNILDNNLIKKELAWSPKVSLEEGLQRTWEWFGGSYKP
ncbi:MAG: NAD-dependent epimerase/dehydratase family protein [Candidatus Komeilibacteria bacterium]|nr:NAD-dependent epimerase/dehydratase family protein [Candidatus Komeilibacteria bacterium]